MDLGRQRGVAIHCTKIWDFCVVSHGPIISESNSMASKRCAKSTYDTGQGMICKNNNNKKREIAQRRE